MRLIIAEKPAVAMAIGEEVGLLKREDGYIVCKDDTVVTWAFGHLLETAPPEHYLTGTNKKWNLDDLPIFPEVLALTDPEDSGKKKQLKIILKQLKSCDSVVHAGDPDREGQLLIDELLEYSGEAKKKVYRYIASSLDPEEVKKGLHNLEENEKYTAWGLAAKGRQLADWIVGINLTRAFSVVSGTLLTVGRVQTPTLALVVARDNQIEDFSVTVFYRVVLDTDIEDEVIPVELVYDDGQILDKNIAVSIIDGIKSISTGKVRSCSVTTKKEEPPVGYSLTTLSAACSKAYGYSAESILKICQELYEKKLITYPRTDSRYLLAEQYADAPSIIDTIGSMGEDFFTIVEGVDLSKKSKIWNTSKVTAHHAIVPTAYRGVEFSSLSIEEQKVYTLVVQRYICQFYPPCVYTIRTLSVEVGEYVFNSSEKQLSILGWRSVLEGDTKEITDVKKLISFSEGGSVAISDVRIEEGKTSPPARFSEGSLLLAMENIHKYIENPEEKKFLRENDGIGTPATRAQIISELKRRGYLESIGKSIQSTVLGKELIRKVSKNIKSPELTALFERILRGIQYDDKPLDSFIVLIHNLVKEEIRILKEKGVSFINLQRYKPKKLRKSRGSKGSKKAKSMLLSNKV